MFEDVEKSLWEHDVQCNFCWSPGPHKVILENVRDSHHTLVECQCGLRFFSPRLSWEWMKREIYERDAGKEVAFRHLQKGYMLETGDTRFTTAEQKAITAHHYHLVAERLHYHVTAARPRVLDIGSGIGLASKHFREIGFLAHNSIAVELCPHAAGIAERAHSLDVRNMPFCEVDPKQQGLFDLIFANDYIEHTYTPFSDLAHMRSFVRSGATLYLKTFAEELDEPAGRTMICPPWHQYHITTDKLVEMLGASGWSTLSISVMADVQIEVIARAQ